MYPVKVDLKMEVTMFKALMILTMLVFGSGIVMSSDDDGATDFITTGTGR